MTFSLLGALLASGLCESNCGHAPLLGATVGALVGAVTGVTAGAVIGSFIPRWHEEQNVALVVEEGALARLPVKAHLSAGQSTVSSHYITQGGVSFVAGNTRVGVELGSVEDGNAFSFTRQSAFDERLRTTTQIDRSSGHAGLAMERQVVPGLFVLGSATRQWSREVEHAEDLGNPDVAGYPHRTVTQSTRYNSGFGGSGGVVVRHRVIGDAWLRIDARQHWGPTTFRLLTVGIEL